MWPLGQYERLVFELKNREKKDIPVTFGLLIADYHQQSCREYILNYINRFDYKSGQYINFYLPGYLEKEWLNPDEKITINRKDFYFNRELYLKFLDKLEDDFKIEYPYNPILILLEYFKGHFSTARRIIIELNENGSDIKQVGKVFDKIFEIANEKVSLADFSKELMKDKLKESLLDYVIEGINNSYLTAIINKNKEVNKYKLKEVSA